MSAGEEKRTPSLIAQRQKLERGRVAVCAQFVFAAVIGGQGIARLVEGGDWWWFDVLAIVCAVIFAGYGVVLTVGRRRRLRSFEAAHGRDAGRQTPVT